MTSQSTIQRAFPFTLMSSLNFDLENKEMMRVVRRRKKRMGQNEGEG